jgi:predicted nucleotidyltransferase
MPSIADSIGEIAERHQLADLYVFGSRAAEIAALAKGEPSPFSRLEADVDIGVRPRRANRLSGYERVRIALEMEDLLNVRRVDLVVLAEATPFLAVEIIRGELLFSEDPGKQAEDELYILRRAADLAPFALERERLVLREGAR